MSRDNWALAICLLGVILPLLIVGDISGTLLRHVIQVTPAIIVLVLVGTRATWAPGAALPIFIFWQPVLEYGYRPIQKCSATVLFANPVQLLVRLFI